MGLSRKVILASCVSAAFLAFGVSCMVEDRNIEDKGVFVCIQNSDCLEGSICDCSKEQAIEAECGKGSQDSCAWTTYKASATMCDKLTNSDGSESYIEGTCARESDINHCQDKDNDGYMKPVSSEFAHECGFSDSFPQDPDDNNATVYPGAVEVCDGADNDGDGCLDGTCEKDDDGVCKTDDSGIVCLPIVDPCIGNTRNIYDNTFRGTMCSVDKVGGMLCKNGKYVFAKTTDYKTFTEDPEGHCPTEEEQRNMRYSDSEFPYNNIEDKSTYATYVYAVADDGTKSVTHLCDEKDNDCNGMMDEGCQKCSVVTGKEFCVAVVAGDDLRVEVSQDNDVYQHILNQCKEKGLTEDQCGCLGKMTCPEELGAAVCTKGSLTFKTIEDVKKISNSDTTYDWQCTGFEEL